MKLHHTEINTYKDSCKTYALKRVGLFHLLNEDKDTPSVESICTGNDFIKLTTPEIGSILVWLWHDKTPYWIAQIITEDGKILSKSRVDYGHCGVYEGNDLVSDCMWEQEWGSIIRMRKYSEIKEPDFILKYNQANNNSTVNEDDFF